MATHFSQEKEWAPSNRSEKFYATGGNQNRDPPRTMPLWYALGYKVEEILQNLTYKQIFDLREVNSMWHKVAVKLINKGCQHTLEKFDRTFKYLERVNAECKFGDANRYRTAYYEHLFHLTWSYLEIIQSEFKLTAACIQRYYGNHEDICVCNVNYLDYVNWLISRIYKYPWRDLANELLYDPALDRCHLDTFRFLTKNFIIDFHYHIEMPLNNNCSVSGAKIVDILDTLLERPDYVVKKVHFQEYDLSTKLIKYKATYTLYNAWFSQIIDPNSSTSSGRSCFNNIHYFHYLRFVRLVRYHNRFTSEIIHERRMGRSEFNDDTSSPVGIKLIGNGANNGYVYDYGCMNDCMKRIKYSDRIQDTRLEFSIDLTSSFRQSSMELQDYLKSNHRDLDYESRELQMTIEVINKFSVVTELPEQWSIQIP
ncbi:hypothetical protein WDU94_007245 [Cyamophila willieti]